MQKHPVEREKLVSIRYSSHTQKFAFIFCSLFLVLWIFCSSVLIFLFVADDLSSLFEKKDFKDRPRSTGSKSTLSLRLEQCPQQLNNPFNEYSKFDGKVSTFVSRRSTFPLKLHDGLSLKTDDFQSQHEFKIGFLSKCPWLYCEWSFSANYSEEI